MEKAIQILIVFLFSLGCLGYLYGIFQACRISLQKIVNVDDMPPFLSNIITNIGAVLATNLGAVLGIAINNPASKYNMMFLNPFTNFAQSGITGAQILACYIYTLALVVVAIVWGIKKFTTDPKQIVSTIPELTKTLLGVIVGVFAITLVKEN